MDNSDKLTWLARIIALVVMAFALSVLGWLQQKAAGPYTHTIQVTADGNPDEIVAALERLVRPDLTTKVKEVPLYDRSGLLAGTLGMTIALGFYLGFYHALYCAVNALLSKLHPDRTLIEPA